MRRIFPLLLMALLLGLWAYTPLHAQTALVCNDMVYISLDEDCSISVPSEAVLEGGPYCCYNDYIVELDKTPPFGNGPWVSALLGSADINKTYQVRVTDPATNIKCWGNIKAEDKLPPNLKCTGLTVANLSPIGSVTLQAGDLQVSAEDACSSAAQTVIEITNQSSVTYTCTQLGINVISVTATDALGNSGTCLHTVLVRDPANYCIGAGSGCTTGCPPSEAVTFEQGHNVLLPAFQANNWAVFDPYGAPTFDGSCTPSDTTYEVLYAPPALGQTWFTREWTLTLGGQPFGKCKQWVVFPASRALTFEGHVFVDTLVNCAYDAGEPGVSIFKVSATRMPSNQRVEVSASSTGAYSLLLDSDHTDTLIVVRLELPGGLSSGCPTVYTLFPDTLQTGSTLDFGLVSEEQCPLTQVSIGNGLLRRCFDNNYYHVQYCNSGFLAAEDAYITIEMDPLLIVQEASLPFTQSGQTLTFQLGDIPAFTCGKLWVRTKVSCDAMQGQTLCADATIFPHDPCGGGAWNGPFVEARATCEGDSVRLEVRNIGQQDMSEMLEFIVVEDIIMRTSKSFMLPAGQATGIKVPANGSTWRIQTTQESNYPFLDRPIAFMEGCGGMNKSGLPIAFALNDDPLFEDVECTTVVGSYDPNDKSAVPTGYGAAHTLAANTDLEYKIRFQNTGTDTAFTVVVEDRLSPLLDWSTFEAGASSHIYRADVLPQGLIRFVFSNILLPDSNTNLAASQGFVKFRIAQKRDLPTGSVIENKAAIFFDFNDPVITNTTYHTIGEPYVTVSTRHLFLPDVQVEVRPNPFQDKATLELRGHVLRDGHLKLYNAQGQVVSERVFEANQCTLLRQGLSSGTYFFLITDGSTPISSGQVQVK